MLSGLSLQGLLQLRQMTGVGLPRMHLQTADHASSYIRARAKSSCKQEAE